MEKRASYFLKKNPVIPAIVLPWTHLPYTAPIAVQIQEMVGSDKTRVFKNQTGFDKNKQNVPCGDLMGKYLNPPQKYCEYLLGGEIISSFKLIF